MLIYFSSNKILKTFHSQPDYNSCLSYCPQLPFICDPDIVALVSELS